jgi:hypothetical protein
MKAFWYILAVVRPNLLTDRSEAETVEVEGLVMKSMERPVWLEETSKVSWIQGFCLDWCVRQKCHISFALLGICMQWFAIFTFVKCQERAA